MLNDAHDEWQVSDRRYLGLDVLARARATTTLAPTPAEQLELEAVA